MQGRELTEQIFMDPEAQIECVQIAPFDRNRCFILFECGTVDHELAQSFIFRVDDFNPQLTESSFVLDDWMISLTCAPGQALHALEVGRTVWSRKDADWSSAVVADTTMKRLWSLAPDATFLVGSDGKAYRFDGAVWRAIPPNCVGCLYDIHGTDMHSIVAVGGGGSAQRLKGSAWSRIDLPFQTEIRAVNVSRDGAIRLAGEDGLCMRLINEELVPFDAPATDLYSIAEFQDTIYWGDNAFGVYRETGGGLEEVFRTEFAFDMRSSRDYLYVAATDKAWRYDGTSWKSLRPVFEDGWRLVGE